MIHIDGPDAAPVLLLINALGTTCEVWDAQLPTLMQRFRVVRYELPGHSGTDAPDGPYSIANLGMEALGVLDSLPAKKASIAGLSLGGMIAMWIASHKPERVENIVLACTAPQLPPATAWAERAASVRASGTASIAKTLLSRWFTANSLETKPGMWATASEMLARVSPEGYAGCCEAIAAMDQWSDLDKITVPALIVCGAHDPVATPEIALRMHRTIPDSSLVILPNAAHLANVEQPSRFTRALVDHLIGVDIDRGLAMRQAVLGESHPCSNDPSPINFTLPFADFIIRYAWGDIWTRPGLDLRARSCITLALLTALGRTDELSIHVKAARRNGLSEADIGEVLLHTAIYCGLPNANSAFRTAKEALQE